MHVFIFFDSAFLSFSLSFLPSFLPSFSPAQSLAALERLIRERAAATATATTTVSCKADENVSGGFGGLPSSPIAPRIDTKLFVTPAKGRREGGEREEEKVSQEKKKDGNGNGNGNGNDDDDNDDGNDDYDDDGCLDGRPRQCSVWSKME